MHNYTEFMLSPSLSICPISELHLQSKEAYCYKYITLNDIMTQRK